MFRHLLTRLNLASPAKSSRRGRAHAASSISLAVEPMESRLLLSATQLVADINQTQASIFYDTEHTNGVEFDGVFYFVGGTQGGNAGTHHEIWSYDPSANGGAGLAVKVGEIPIEESGAEIFEMTVLGDHIYFYTNSDTHQFPLWKFDPATGTGQKVGLISNADRQLDVAYLTPLGGKLYFSSYSAASGRELWQFDPNANGGSGAVSLAANIAASTTSSNPEFLTALNGKLYFSAHDGVTGDELYEYNPVTGTARRAADINPGAGSSSPYHLVALGGKLYFGANDGATGFELWQFDPSASGGAGAASLTVDVVAGGHFNPGLMTVLGNSIYFSANDGVTGFELWRYTPGAAAGAGEMRLVRDLYVGSEPGDPFAFTTAAGKLYFNAEDGNTGYELWEYDPASDTLSLAADLWEGSESSDPKGLVGVGETVLFHAFDGNSRLGLWAFDASANTGEAVLVTDPNADVPSSFPDQLTVLDEKLYFTAFTPASGYELWQYIPGPNGTPGTVKMVADISSGASSSEPGYLTAFDGKLYFSASNESTGHELWQYDPLANGGLGAATLLADLNSGAVSSYPRQLTILDGTLYFTADLAEGSRLLALDLTTAGAVPIVYEDFQASQLTAFNGRLYFSRTDGVSGFELWHFDPATMNTPEQLADINPGAGSSSPSSFTVLNGKLYFTADNGTGVTLGQYDPSANGGTGVVSVAVAADGNLFPAISEIATLNGQLYFSATDATGDMRLFQYVPAATAGQPGAALFVGGMVHENISELTAAGERLYFSAQDSGGDELWEFIPGTDGGVGTMRRVADIIPGSQSSFPYDLTELNGRLYFSAEHPDSGKELWVHDPKAFSVGDGARVELSFARANVPVGTINNNGPSTGSSFHEWEDATGQLWLTIDEDLPNAPFDLTWEMTSAGNWFLAPQLQSHLGTAASSLTTVLNGTVLSTTGTIAGLDLSGKNVGDRVLIATLVYPVDVENGKGVPMSQAGTYPSANTAHGVQLVSAQVNGSGQPLDREEDVAGKFVPVIYDADDNGAVGLSDFSAFVSHFGRIPGVDDPGAYRFDYDRNGKVGLSDFVLFVRHFGTNKVDGDEAVDMPGLLGGTQGRPAPQGFSSGSSSFVLEGEPAGAEPITGFSPGYEWEPSVASSGASTSEPFGSPGAEIDLRSRVEEPRYILDLNTLQFVPYSHHAAPEIDATFGDDEWAPDDDLSWVDELEFGSPSPPPLP